MRTCSLCAFQAPSLKMLLPSCASMGKEGLAGMHVELLLTSTHTSQLRHPTHIQHYDTQQARNRRRSSPSKERCAVCIMLDSPLVCGLLAPTCLQHEYTAP
jgi:hypothetical protein